MGNNQTEKPLIDNSVDNFDADLPPVYDNERKKKRFLPQGKKSFFSEFYTLYRKLVKRD